MELKFGEIETLIKLMPMFMLRDLFYFERGLIFDWKTTTKAVLWVTRNMRFTMRKRSIIQSERRISDAALKSKFPGEVFVLGREKKFV
jgi:hypothetical protein